MRFVLVQVLVLCVLLGGCSGFFVGFVSNQTGTVHVTGTVTIVQFGFVQDPTGLLINVTTVTFLDSANAVTINFCGDQRSQFPINRFVRADFNTGLTCSSLVAVVVIS